MLDMKGAHMDHKSRHDGAFFMAPNKMHHLEGKYSERCGFQLHLFNAFTKPISVERFRAFITVIPSHDHEAEITRFLEPNKDRTVMTARVGATVQTAIFLIMYDGADRSGAANYFRPPLQIMPTAL